MGDGYHTLKARAKAEAVRAEAELERLEAENERLREALERILERLDPTRTANPLHKASEVVSIARAALDPERSLEARE